MVKNHEKEIAIVDFKFYISLIRENKIPWNAFVKLLEDLTPTYDKLKELNSVLLEELKSSLDFESNHDELDYDNFKEDIEDYQAKQDVKVEGIDSETLAKTILKLMRFIQRNLIKTWSTLIQKMKNLKKPKEQFLKSNYFPKSKGNLSPFS